MNIFKRRTVVAGLGSLAATSFLGASTIARTNLRVGVIGGGIVGASIALHLAASGAKVTLFEKTAIAAGATGNSFAWINASSTVEHYRKIRLASINGWRKLDQELGLGILWGGALRWQPDGPAATRLLNTIKALEGTGYPLQNLSHEDFAEIAGEFRPEDIGSAGYSDIDGHLDPVAVTGKLISRAISLGVTVKMPCAVEGITMKGDQLQGVKTTCGDVPLDRLVVAAGVDTPDVTSIVGYRTPLVHAPGILAHTSPVNFATKKVVYAPGVHFKQFADGRIVGADAEEPPQTIAHELIKQQTIKFPSKEIEDMHTMRIIEKVADVFPTARGAGPDRLTLGFRPKPKDGLPVIGYVPGSSSIYSAVMHSGVTLAPVVGQLVAKEIMEDTAQTSLSPYRPERFL